MNDKIIDVDNVSIMLNLGKEKIDNLKEYFVKLIQGKLLFDEFWALKNVSFSINKGDSLGVLGLNGAGKSTLLKIIAGVMKPTIGTVKVKGVIAPLIELGAGFDMELSARENVFLNGSILGNSRKFMQDHFNEIIDFAELWEFVDVPMKNYSSGMVARLGFSIATLVEPDILIADEILSVGDYKFREKCEERMNNIMKKGTSIILVSHDINQIKSICNKAIWLEKGGVHMFGDSSDVSEKYSNCY